MFFISVCYVTFSRSLCFRKMLKLNLLILCCIFGASLAQNTYVLLNKDNFQQQIAKGNTIVVFVNDAV